MLKLLTSKWTLGLMLGIIYLTMFETAYSKEVFISIPSNKINKIASVMGLKTFQGKFVTVKMIHGLGNKSDIMAQEIIDKPQIELKNGEILYPEEIDFFITRKNTLNARAPEGDD